LSFSLQQRLSRHRDAGVGWRLDAQAPWQVTRGLTLVLSGSRAHVQNGQNFWEVFLGLNLSLDGGHYVSTGGRLTQDGPSGTAEISKSLPAGEGYGYRVGGALAEHSNAQVHLQYQALFGRYDARYSYFDDHRLALEAAGALVVVPGVGLFPTLPVRSSFGIIRVPGVEGVRGYVNNNELGRTDAHGNVVVPNLLSYYGNRMGIEQLDVPIEYEVPVTEYTLAPPIRGVAVAEFALRMPHFYRGKVVVLDGDKRVIPEYGELRAAGPDGEVMSPLSELGEFDLDGISPGRNTMHVDYLDGTCTFEVDVPDGDTLIIELGELVCER
jgi:outer membrane usher protein